MADGAIAHDGLAFDDLSGDIHLLIEKHDANAFADGAGITTDRDKLILTFHANGDVARQAEDSFPA